MGYPHGTVTVGLPDPRDSRWTSDKDLLCGLAEAISCFHVP